MSTQPWIERLERTGNLAVVFYELSRAYNVERQKIEVTQDVIREFCAIFEKALEHLPNDTAARYRNEAALLFQDANRRFDARGISR